MVDAWFSLDASSSSNITNTGVRDPNDPVFAVYNGPDSGLLTSPDSVAYAGTYTDWALASPGWAWTDTGTQSSSLSEAVGQTLESPGMYTEDVSPSTSLVTLERSTSASELSSSATVLRTDSGSSTEGGSWSSTSSAGSYTSPGSGISPKAQALVPVGSDGLAFAMYNSPTNSVSDYMPMGHDDLLSGGTMNIPGAETLHRGYTTGLATQQTLPSPAGAASTNTSYAEPGTTGGVGAGATEDAERVLGPAGMHFVETISDIIASGDEAAIKSLTNQVVSAIAPFIVCDGNNCTTVWQTEVATGDSSQTTTGVPVGSGGGSVRTAAQTSTMPKELDDATREALNEVAENWEKDVNPLLRRAERCTGEWPERTYRGDDDVEKVIMPVLVRVVPAIQTVAGDAETSAGLVIGFTGGTVSVVAPPAGIVGVPAAVLGAGLAVNGADVFWVGLQGLWNPYEEHETYGRKLARDNFGPGGEALYDIGQLGLGANTPSLLLPKGPVNAVDDGLRQVDNLPPLHPNNKILNESLDARNDKLDDLLKAMDKAEADNLAKEATDDCVVGAGQKLVPKGGEYGKVRSGNQGGQVHHTPAAKVTPYEYRKAPSVWMETTDHQKTASWGRRKSAQAYRDKQDDLINSGKLREAIQMDIDDIRSKFGNRYDANIKQMLESFGFSE